MAQQTRIATVVPYYERFLACFPDVRTLARAPLNDVLAGWSGLGYYRRAHHLHQSAQIIMKDFAGELPSDVEALQKLPGIGRYIAGAIASIAFNIPAPILDANVARLFIRLYDLPDDLLVAKSREKLWRLVEIHVPPTNPRAFNEGIMELGALVCALRSPACPQCPLKRICLARRRGTIQQRPLRKKKPAVPTVHLNGAVIRRRDGAVLLLRNADRGLYAGLWSIPQYEAKTSNGAALTPPISNLRVGLETTKKIGRVTHVLSHRKLALDLYAYRLLAVPRLPKSAFRWVRTNDNLRDLGVSSLTRKVLKAIFSPAR